MAPRKKNQTTAEQAVQDTKQNTTPAEQPVQDTEQDTTPAEQPAQDTEQDTAPAEQPDQEQANESREQDEEQGGDQEEKPDQETERDEFADIPNPCVYCGPSVRGVARQYTTYQGGIPNELKEFVKAHPAARRLIVSTGKFAAVRKRLETYGTAEAILYEKVKSELR